ncbi:hypothetical protein M8J76_013034 [Diaphorina citri]|nr:hypothetical protein M8J75_006628 [Diaphorina citri]KAI5716449.1 hypothetical protein M8J76_006516 [Diaphorina citri]KAI5741385.1 hypothetical protein M8J76_013034 [Diaphorina citri]
MSESDTSSSGSQREQKGKDWSQEMMDHGEEKGKDWSEEMVEEIEDEVVELSKWTVHAPRLVFTGNEEKDPVINFAGKRTKGETKKMAGKRAAELSPKQMMLHNTHEVSTHRTIILIEELEKVAEELMNLTKAHTQTKKEIKDAARKINLITGKLVSTKEEIKEMSKETDRSKISKKLVALCKQCKKKVTEEEDKIKLIEEEIAALQRVEDEKEYADTVRKIARGIWEEKIFLKTKIRKGLKEGPNQNMAVIVNKGAEKSNLIFMLRSKFPEMDDLLNEEDVLQYSESSTTTNKGRISKRKLYLIKSKNEEETIKALKTICEKEREGDLDIASTEGVKWSSLRQQIEAVFRHSQLAEVSLVVPQNYEQRVGNISNRKVDTQKAGTINITMKETGESKEKLDELMRKMMREVNIEQIGVQVQTIRKDNNGEYEIKAKEERKGGLEDFTKKVTNSLNREALVKSTSHNYGRRTKTLVVRNIDITTTTAEVTKAVEEQSQIQNAEVKVISLKPNFKKDSLVGMVEMPEEVACAISQRRTMKVGWVSCPVSLLITPPQCYKCLRHGHLGAQCSSDTEGGIKCRKCTQGGHVARECKNTAKCADCGEEHPAGTMKCRVYRDIVDRERRGEQGWEREKSK